MAEFLYRIGDILQHKADPGGYKLFVIGRVHEECYGGCQNHYTLRGWAPKYSWGGKKEGYFVCTEKTQMLEIELEPWTEKGLGEPS